MAGKTRRKRTAASSGLTFNHAMVYVREAAPAVHFYPDWLGFKVIEVFRGRNAAVYARLRSPRGNSTLAPHLLEPGQSLPENEGARLYFEVKDLDKRCKELEAAGVKFQQPPAMMPWGWKHAYVNDPDGHEVSLYWAGAKGLQKSQIARP